MKTDEEYAKAEEEYVKAIEVTKDYDNDVQEIMDNLREKIKQDIKDKPFLMVVKVLVRLVAFFIVILKPSSMKWFSLIRIAVNEFSTNLHEEIASVEFGSEFEEDSFGGVPMEITKDCYIQHFDNA